MNGGHTPISHDRDSGKFIAIGCTFAALGVAAGAFGAHGLRSTLSPEMLSVFETAVRYHMYHAFGLIVTGVIISLMPTGGSRWLRRAGWFFAAGIILFSGSLYLLSVTGIRWLGVITPFGGVAFIAGWALLALGAWRSVGD